MMASPVQLIRMLGQSLGAAVPTGVAAFLPGSLAIPAEQALGSARKSASRWVSVTGDLDPIGGHFLRKQASWAYMNITELEAISIVDQQTLIGTGDERVDLSAVLRGALNAGPPAIALNNPHSWLGYLKRHEQELATWFA